MESVYNLIRRDDPAVRKKRMYRSKHDPKRPVDSTFGRDRRAKGSLGSATAKPKPSKFLKSKRDKGVVPSQKTKKFVRTGARRKAPLPKEAPVMGLKTTKDFVVANAVENILAVPANANAARVNYLKKKDYGQVPDYLHQVRRDIDEEKRVISEYFSDQNARGDGDEGELLPDAERQDLLQKLKKKWGAVNARYQKISHNTILDTVGKVKRKEMFEKELDQLEKDIKLLSSKRPIVIVDY